MGEGIFYARPASIGMPGDEFQECGQRRKDADKDGNRRQRRAWARQQGKPMPRKGEDEKPVG